MAMPDMLEPGKALLAYEEQHPDPPGFAAAVDSGSYLLADVEYGLAGPDKLQRAREVGRAIGSVLCGDCYEDVPFGEACAHLEVSPKGRVSIKG